MDDRVARLAKLLHGGGDKAKRGEKQEEGEGETEGAEGAGSIRWKRETSRAPIAAACALRSGELSP